MVRPYVHMRTKSLTYSKYGHSGSCQRQHCRSGYSLSMPMRIRAEQAA